MIRAATVDDVGALLPMAEQFWGMTPWAAVIPFEREQARVGLSIIADNPATRIFVIEREGVLAGTTAFGVAPIWIRADTLVAQELFWWVEPEGSREALALWRTAEEWCQAQGASAGTMIRIEGLRDAALDRMYRSRGYNPVEHLYLKRF